MLEHVGEPPDVRLRAARPPRARRAARRDRHRARRQGVRRAVLLPHRRRRAAAARRCSTGDRAGGASRVHPDDHAGAGQAGGDGGHRLPRRSTPSEVYRLEADDLYLVGTSEVPLAAYHIGRDPRRRPAAAALRRLVVVLPPRGRLVRQGHPRHHPGAPVRQGRDVLLLPARGGRRPSTCGCSAGRRRCWPRSSCPTG